MQSPVRLPAKATLWAALRLVRLSNSLPASGLLILGALRAGTPPELPALWLAAAAMWCVTACGYCSNDYFDLEVDRVNRPDRPIPSGLISRRAAGRLALALGAGALILASPLGMLPTAAAAAVLALLILYQLRLKSSPGAGNLLIGLLAGGTLLSGAYLNSGLTAALLPAGLLASFVTARELLKTVEDLAGDRAAGLRTVAVAWGPRRSVALAAGFALLAALLWPLPTWLLGYSAPYLAVAGGGVIAPLLATVIWLWPNPTPGRVSRCLALLKGSYFAGLLALLLA